MTRYERKLFFERLLALRDAYRAETHTAVAMSIDDAMTFARDTFDALAAQDVEAGAAGAAVSEAGAAVSEAGSSNMA